MRLPRENKVPSEPRFSYVTEKAYDFLLEYGYETAFFELLLNYIYSDDIEFLDDNDRVTKLGN